MAESREDRLERLKKDVGSRPNSRPMGYIYPKRIKEIMHGETPVIKVGYTPESKAKRTIGEKWIDENGKEWEQKEGYTISVPKYIEDTRVPEACPKCGKSMYDKEYKLNEKFYWLRGNCFNCQLAIEMKIRTSGPDAWAKYEQEILIQNAMSFLKDAKKEIEEYLPTLKNLSTYVTEDGTLEKWEGDSTQLKELLTKELDIINEDLSFLERDLKELKDDPTLKEQT